MFCRFSFYFGLFISLRFFGEQEGRGLFKGGPSAPMNQIFTDSLFILGSLFSLCFLEEQKRKGFPLIPLIIREGVQGRKRSEASLNNRRFPFI
jgi:hypothetical protein